MPIRTETAIHGFIASEPRLTYTERGEARLYARVGRDRFERAENGDYVQLDPDFHDLLMWGRSAERACETVAKGDRFIAEGRVVERERQVDGHSEISEAFVASRIGLDLNVMTVSVHRRREAAAAAAPAVTAEAASEGTTPAGEQAVREAVAQREAALPSAATNQASGTRARTGRGTRTQAVSR